MDWLNTPCTVANDQPEVTAESIMEAVKEFERLQAEREQSEERVDCVVAPIEAFDDLPVVKSPGAINGCPYVDIGRERYVFDPEVLQRIKSKFSIYRPMPLTLNWKK